MIKTDKSILNVAVITALLLIMSCDNDNFAYFIDSRDGKKYKTVKIGNQIWIAENLNYNASGSKCYDNELANCEKYGRLYDWATAMALPNCGYGTSCGSQIGAKHRGICPAGWHIPSNDDWDELMRYVDGVTGSGLYDSPTAGRHLKAQSGCSSGGNGDTYGFAALPGGYGRSDGSFSSAGDYGRWWSASEGNAYYAYYRYVNYNYEYEYADWSSSRKYNLFSVRCVGD